MNVEEKLSRDLAQRKALQVSMLKAKFATRKKEKMKKLREKQEAEKAKVELVYLKMQCVEKILHLIFLILIHLSIHPPINKSNQFYYQSIQSILLSINH